MIQEKWVDPDRVAYQKWLAMRLRHENETKKKHNFRDFVHSVTPPKGYTQIGDAGQTIVFPVATDVAYGEGAHCFFQSGVVGSITFNNANFGDPSYSNFKGAFAKITDSVQAAPPVAQAAPAVTSTSGTKASATDAGSQLTNTGAVTDTTAVTSKSKATIYIVIAAVVLVGGAAIFMYSKRKKK